MGLDADALLPSEQSIRPPRGDVQGTRMDALYVDSIGADKRTLPMSTCAAKASKRPKKLQVKTNERCGTNQSLNERNAELRLSQSLS